jgi:hypothetical protein
MQTININNTEYIHSEYVLKNTPFYSKGCRSSRDLVKKRDIKDFVYAKETNGNWIITEGKSIRFDKVLIKKSFVDNISELKQSQTERKQVKKEIVVDGIQYAPDVINLKDNEKFKNDKGEIIEIKTIGERKVDKIFFRVKDVMKNFGMDFLNDAIIKKTGGYKSDIDYVYFIVKPDNYRRTTNKNKTADNTSDNKVIKELYLTYIGILRVLFVSRNNNVNSFIKWAAEKLFALQMGSNEQKKQLVADTLGVSAKVISELLNTDTNTLPCVYLFSLGYVKDLRESIVIDDKYKDDDIVYKYGFTKDLGRRTNEHIAKYNKIKGVELKLKYHCYVDPQYVSDAEGNIRNTMKALNSKLDYDNTEELVVLTNNTIQIVKDQFELAGKKYMGHFAEIITRNKELETALNNIKTQTDFLTNAMKYEHELNMNKIKTQTELTLEKMKNENELNIEKMKSEHDKIIYEKNLTIEKQEKEIMRLNYENQILSLKLELQNK